MANNRFNSQIKTIPEKTSGGKGVLPQTGEIQKVALNVSSPSWPGLPGKSGPDRAAGMPEEKIYASAQGLRGGVDSDPGPSGGPSHKDF